ncbi:uncharacterized protein I206_102054 [Kwoniella pini CBS 10737]|uniref:Oxidoreductase-like domain-containing protein n=1 Tax=Kwoniella pini CBS 10737 TaxID=1296096 RepID=A0A1B9HUZ1_9TREE|nr:uncharacterized protein I206_06853 [Kwoniella pini CBS 10737]OCF47078.1 hypothetical protein I206_06853 [Kwoniella pini CBS 10737]
MRRLINPKNIASSYTKYASQNARREISNIPPTKRKRVLNVLAEFQKPLSRVSLQEVIGGPSNKKNPSKNDEESFVTASTKPVLASIQEIPSTNEGTKIVNTLPAMKEIPLSKKSNQQIKNNEIIMKGIIIPPKPIPPGEEECCMSGCVNCVYTIYADDLEIYNLALESAKQALKNDNIPQNEWPIEIRDKTNSEDVKGQIEHDVDPVMNAFLALENKLKKK